MSLTEYIIVCSVAFVWIILARTLLRRNYSAPKKQSPDCDPLPAGSIRTLSAPAEDTFACTVRLVADKDGDEDEQAFSVMVSGRIQVPTPMYDTDVQVLLADVTEDVNHPMPVLCTLAEWQLEDSTAFCCRKHNGKIPRTDCVLTDWIGVVTIPTRILSFPRKRETKLRCIVSLISSSTNEELNSAAANFTYRNTKLGYLDASDNADNTELLALSLAAGVLRIAPVSLDAQSRVIDQWIERRVMLRHDSRRQQHGDMLHNAVKHVLEDAGPDRQSYTDICSRLVSIATIVELFDAMELCLNVVAAGGLAGPAQTDAITTIARALDIDETKFRAMAQKKLPLGIHQEPNLEFILGIHCSMTDELRIKRLNEEYYKWNARVNHPDPAIRAQADQMLNLIADARNSVAQTASA
jgi:hypothetical protein